MTAAAALGARDLAHLERAVALARTARERGDEPFGALVAAVDGTIIEGMNCVVSRHDPTGHAETNLVRAASAVLDLERLSSATLYTSSEPCAMCAGAIYWSGLGRLVYAIGHDALRSSASALGGVPALTVPCRDVFAGGGRDIEVVGPVEMLSASRVHEGYWR